jgi:hypothetical protein
MMCNHHLRVPPQEMVPPLDSPLGRRIAAREMFSEAVPLPDQTVDLRQKNG